MSDSIRRITVVRDAKYSLPLSLMTSALLQVRFPGRFIISVLYKIPLVVPSLVAAFLVLTIIDQGGIIARALQTYGLGWRELVHGRYGLGMIRVVVWGSVRMMKLGLFASRRG